MCQGSTTSPQGPAWVWQQSSKWEHPPAPAVSLSLSPGLSFIIVTVVVVVSCPGLVCHPSLANNPLSQRPVRVRSMIGCLDCPERLHEKKQTKQQLV